MKSFVLVYFFASLATIMLSGFSTAMAKEQVYIGILAFRPVAEVKQRWQPLVDYLNHKLPSYHFDSKILSYKKLDQAISNREVDFVLTNPAHYIQMSFLNGLSSPVATLIPENYGKALAQFGGVVVVKSERIDIRSLENLRNHSIAVVTKGSLGGYQAQAMELHDLGIQISDDINLIETGMPHDLVVKSVIEGEVDAGFVRTGVIEAMLQEGKIEPNQLKVISNTVKKDYPLMRSTRLYPEWPFSAMLDVDEDLARQVTAVLLSIPHGGEIAKKMAIHGFTIPADYEVVRDTLEALRLPPFDNAPVFTFEDIWNRYRWWISSGLLLIAIIILLTIWLFFLNQRLREGRQHIQHSAQKWRSLLTALGEGVYGIDAKGNCTFINPAAMAMLGYRLDELLGRDLHSLFHHRHENGDDYPITKCPIFLTLKDGKTRNRKEWFWRKDGSGFPVELTTASLGESGFDIGTVVVFRNISQQQRIEKQLIKEATTDPLTRIANRRFFLKQLKMEFDRFKRFNEATSLMMVDIDHFKKINDTYGHATGDEVLKHFADLSQEYLRSADLFGRLGGEEFGIMLHVANIEQGLFVKSVFYTRNDFL